MNAVIRSVVVVMYVSGVLFAQSSPQESLITRYELPSTERDREVDFEHIRIEVRFQPPDKRVLGKVTYVFTPIRTHVDSIVFDAVRIKAHRVEGSSGLFRFRSTDSLLIVYGSWWYNQRDSLSIQYECTPRRGLYFPGWDDPTNRKRKQIWTQGQPFDTRHWVPIYDYPNDKAITELIITADSSFRVLSNGVLRSVELDSDGTKTWHYSMTKPHATYLIMLAVGNYGVVERRTQSGVPLYLWYYADHPEWAEPTYRYSVEMVDFMEQLLGVPFPWDSYSQVPVQDYIAGAMENTTATVFGDFFHGDTRAMLDRSYVAVNVHELTHQWFGDFITQRDERSIWLHESFATFYPKLFFRHFFGQDYYQWMRYNEQAAALNAARGNDFPILHRQSGTARVYSKGSAVLDMLMDVVGEEQFHRAVRHYLRSHAYGTVETRDFERAFADALGMNLSWFFDQWLYRGGEPTYRVRYTPVCDSSGTQWIEFTVEQMQQQDVLRPFFRMPITFEVHFQDGSVVQKRKWIQDRITYVRLPNPDKKSVAFALFDPGSIVLKRVDFPKSANELLAQLRKAPLMIDRYEALRLFAADSTISDSLRANVLCERYATERFFALRALVARELAQNTSLHRFSSVRKTLQHMINDSNVEVRRALISTIVAVPNWLKSDLQRLLQDSSYQVLELALNKLCMTFPDEVSEYLQRVESVEGAQHNVRILREQLKAERGDTIARNTLVDFASPSFEFITRQHAMNALRRLNWCDPTFARHLLEAAVHFNERLAASARQLISHFAGQPRYRAYFVKLLELESDFLRRQVLEQALR